MYLPPIQNRILSLLHNTAKGNGIKRSEICRKLGFVDNKQRTTTYDNLEKLETKGYIERYSKNTNSGRGRPPVFWFITNKGSQL